MAKTTMTVAAALLAAAPLAAATGVAHVINNCADTVTLWSIGDAVSVPSTLATGGSYNETYIHRSSGAQFITIGKSADTLYAKKAQTVLSYTVDDSEQVFYDLSDLFGDAFSGSKVALTASDSSCPSVEWTSGAPASDEVVENVCSTDSDIYLTLCA